PKGTNKSILLRPPPGLICPNYRTLIRSDYFSAPSKAFCVFLIMATMEENPSALVTQCQFILAVKHSCFVSPGCFTRADRRATFAKPCPYARKHCSCSGECGYLCHGAQALQPLIRRPFLSSVFQFA